MQRLKHFMIGFGFFWIVAWSICASVLGSRIEQLTATGADPQWLVSWQRDLLRSAHAHMNLMGMLLIVIALSISQIKNHVSPKNIKLICIGNLISIPIFGFGIAIKAFYPPMNGQISSVSGIAALGGIVYILTIGLWASLFIFAALKKTN